MRLVFADTQFWVALANPSDPRAVRSRQVALSVGDARIFTTDEVLVEFLGFFSKSGPLLRRKAAELCRAVLADPGITVVSQTRDSFLRGMDLYESRPDKGYSLVDCVSMAVMREAGITEVLTADNHFVQEGFVALLR